MNEVSVCMCKGTWEFSDGRRCDLTLTFLNKVEILLEIVQQSLPEKNSLYSVSPCRRGYWYGAWDVGLETSAPWC